MLKTWLPPIWFFIWGFVWAVYFSLDGYDLGAGILSGFSPKIEERQLIKSIGPFWDGNEVWLVAAGGLTFAAFPRLYAIMFSSLYLPLIVILISLIVRSVAIDFYPKSYNGNWRNTWAKTLSVSSFLAALLFGITFGNIFQGLQVDNIGYRGSILSILNPYGLLTGMLFVLLFSYSGSVWFVYATKGEKGYSYARRLFPVVVLALVIFLVATFFATNLWNNYLHHPILFVVPFLAIASLFASRFLVGKRIAELPFFTGSGAVFLIIMTAIIGLFPNMFPSKINPSYTLTAFNASASTYSLIVMLIGVIIFIPLVIGYQAWQHKHFSSVGSEPD